MSLVRRSGRKGIGAAAALALLAALAILALGAGAGSAAAAGCPSFRVLHDDRIGPAVLPAGNYAVTPNAGSGLSCSDASKLFTRFLEDYDGVLPGGWRVIPQGAGKASFAKGTQPGFGVERSGGGEGEGGNPSLGQLCPGSFSVNATTVVGPLRFTKGQFLIYIPARSLISCRRASVLFTRFLAQPGGRLPFPWRLMNQTATFYKPAHPLRSAFRIEPLSGAGRAS
ncbi:MAG: hypothetical protein ACOYD4_13930 [Solirubrobacterales bacterium]